MIFKNPLLKNVTCKVGKMCFYQMDNLQSFLPAGKYCKSKHRKNNTKVRNHLVLFLDFCHPKIVNKI